MSRSVEGDEGGRDMITLPPSLSTPTSTSVQPIDYSGVTITTRERRISLQAHLQPPVQPHLGPSVRPENSDRRLQPQQHAGVASAVSASPALPTIDAFLSEDEEDELNNNDDGSKHHTSMTDDGDEASQPATSDTHALCSTTKGTV